MGGRNHVLKCCFLLEFWHNTKADTRMVGMGMDDLRHVYVASVARCIRRPSFASCCSTLMISPELETIVYV